MSSSRASAGWECRAARPGDEVELAALFERVFERPLSPHQWQRKLWYPDFETANAWVATNGDGTIIGQYGGIPRIFHVPKERIGMFAVDAMTAPEWRRRGVLTELVRRAHDEWREAGVAFVLGLPNENWGSVSSEVGWAPLFELRGLTRVLRPSALIAARAKVAPRGSLAWLDALCTWIWRPQGASSPAVEISHLADGDAESIDRADLQDRDDTPICALRDAAWIERRFLDTWTEPYQVLIARSGGRIAGYVAYRVTESARHRVGVLLDILPAFAPTRATAALIDHAVLELAADGAETVTAQVIDRGSLYRLLKSRGFVFRRRPFLVHWIRLDDELSPELFSSAEGWLLTGGDFDVL